MLVFDVSSGPSAAFKNGSLSQSQYGQTLTRIRAAARHGKSGRAAKMAGDIAVDRWKQTTGYSIWRAMLEYCAVCMVVGGGGENMISLATLILSFSFSFIRFDDRSSPPSIIDTDNNELPFEPQFKKLPRKKPSRLKTIRPLPLFR